MRNSFKELEELEMQEVSMDSARIKNGVNSDIGIMRYVTSVVEMYFPKIVDLFISLAGGSSDKDDNMRKQNKYPDLN
jgi:protein involved in sex pheromone biosynthesis